jgi:hypothetical protein
MASTIKVDNIQNQCGANIIKEDSNTITLGASGDTITLACGASQTGFGRTGTVDWDTTAKTASFTATNGEGYFANTSGGTFTMNLPAGTAGNIVSVVDYTNTFQTNALTISPNGSQKIGGIAASINLTTEGQSVTFVYVDDTEGWKNVQDSTSNVTGNPFIVATGGTITTCGNCKIHTFTGPGTFCVSQVHPCAANNEVSYMVVAGGGSGGYNKAGGGAGAGGFRENKSPVTPYTASPLNGSTPVTVTASPYPIAVGGGGAASPGGLGRVGCNGSNSTFSTITSAGGGGGGSVCGPSINRGVDGGSGGGASGYCGSAFAVGGNGNTPPVSPSQGNNGGANSTGSPDYGSGGGGGATAVGVNGASTGSGSGNGGAGATTNISGSPTAYAGGGGGGATPTGPEGTGGTGGGANGGLGGGSDTAPSGTANTGGGGGGSGVSPGGLGNQGGGGSGIVIVRYKYQ